MISNGKINKPTPLPSYNYIIAYPEYNLAKTKFSGFSPPDIAFMQTVKD
jgi:hypothetical protein